MKLPRRKFLHLARGHRRTLNTHVPESRTGPTAIRAVAMVVPFGPSKVGPPSSNTRTPPGVEMGRGLASPR